MRTLNLGILAHVDAGKTSLTERLLYHAGVIAEIGSVDAGSTQTDSLALERQRGITIKSAVVAFAIDDTAVNLIDTPGHPDFIAEVERVLGVLDGAVLVISAVEGVQSQTRVLMRTLQRLRIPTLIFVNKVDRRGATDLPLLQRIRDRLTAGVVPMGSISRIGTRQAVVSPFSAADDDLVNALAEHDDAVLTAYVRDGAAGFSDGRLRRALARQTAHARVHPVFFGSAITGAGVPDLTAGIRDLLPSATGDPEGDLSGTVFKIERGASGERVAYVRLFSGTLGVRQRLALDSARDARVTAISVFENGSVVPAAAVSAGRIAKVWGLGAVRIGDPVGRAPARSDGVFAPPTLETAVRPDAAAQRGRLHTALAELAEQDPLINFRQQAARSELTVSLYGEVQKEVIQATLAADYQVAVTFAETTTICIERPIGTGAAEEVIKVAPNPFFATVGLRIEPAPAGSGVRYRLAKEVLGTMPLAFFAAVEETVHESLQEGLCGWQVTDCTVTLTRTGYFPRQSHSHGTFDKSMSSTAGDFRFLTPLVLMSALRAAGTRVFEPMHRFVLELPRERLGSVLPVLARLRAYPGGPRLQGSTCLLDGEIPAGKVHELTQLLPGLTQGESVLESAFSRYERVRGPAPSRARSDRNPLDRREYLLSLRGLAGRRLEVE